MIIFQNSLKNLFVLLIFQVIILLPAFSLDLDSTVTDGARQNYSKETQQQTKPVQNTIQNQVQEKIQNPDVSKTNTEILDIKQDLPKVPNLPKNINSQTVAPINTQYSGKMPNSEAFIPALDIKTSNLIIDESALKTKTVSKQTTKKQQTASTKTTSKTYKSIIAKGTQIRAVNQTKITDYLTEGQTITFTSVNEIKNSYLNIPKGTKFTAKVVSSHKPQLSCNGGLVGIRIVSVNLNGSNQTVEGGILKLKTDRIYFSNLKGEHTYCKTVCKKAKWGQNMYSKWAKTSHKLANNGAGVILAPFPYIGGCVLAGASTISSPVTALLGKGGHLTIPQNTAFTIKFYEDAKIK